MTWIILCFLSLGYPRLRAQPHGLGKGHDAAIVGAWLDQELLQIDLVSVAACT